ncbi:mitotic fidelity of chromosome transmission- protein [Gnomoniopsis sp. IMI 355080]|nr:mitotic fidelity of chromosome transmission- protein [Gnomoniopsis sp. IMI 355080]
MAPRQSSAQRRSTATTEAFHDLGVRGRKTGVFLKDTGARDEHGMQPLDDIFSSPDKENDGDEPDEESDEEPMDIDEVTAPAPSAFMNGPPPRYRSPPKTNLNSPARRAPGLSSSPLRPAHVTSSPSGARSVQRQLNFQKNNGLLANKPTLPRPNGVKGKGKAAAATNGYGSSSENEQEHEQEEESMAMLDGADDYGVDEEQEQEPEPEDDAEEEEEEQEEEEVAPPSSAKKGKGRPKKTAPPPIQEEDESDAVIASIEEVTEPAEEEPARAGKKRGRPSKKTAMEDEAEKQPAAKKTKRVPNVGDEQAGSSNQASAPKPRGRKPKAAVAEGAESSEATSIPAAKKKLGRKRISNGVGDTSVAEVPRGPPLPKSRGLVISRRETPGAGSMFTTRSGRTSFQPLKYWANERAELDDDDEFFDGKEKIRLPHIKNIVRYDEPEPKEKSTSRRGKGARGKPGRKKRGGFHDDADDDLEPWEEDGDIITGEVVVWQPEHEFNPPGPDEQIEVAPDEQIAVSANAIETREIRNASFKFAKTLSMPFFGSGVVDLPPNTEKKPKNSRKMHMSFFVFAGRVQVTVADTVFSIGRGGMWFVPRGNYYSIENVSDKPARIFFSQGCEINGAAAGDVSQMA